jgi:hypothetical protein
MFDSISNFWNFFTSIIQTLPSAYIAFLFWIFGIILLIGIISFFVELIK